jgi:hypothetical protein
MIALEPSICTFVPAAAADSIYAPTHVCLTHGGGGGGAN